MIATNDEIYNIFRKDLHLSEKKTRQLVSKMDTAINKAQADKFASKNEVKEVSLKLEFVTKELAEIKTEVKGLVGHLSTRIAIFMTIAVGIIGVLMRFVKL